MDWHTLSSYLSPEMWRSRWVKRIILIVILLVLGWQYGLKRPIYQHLYGKPDGTSLAVQALDSIQDIPDQPEQLAQISGLTIRLQLMKKITTTARVVYIDRYSKLGTWYRSRPGAKLYDKIVPLDLSWATGQTAQNKKCEYEHEYRCLIGPMGCPHHATEVSNNHTIPANARIQKGLDILKVGDVAYIEGYLVYWQGTGAYAPYRFESAIQLGQVYPHLYGGRNDAILCRQLFLTKLTFDGYTFE